MATVATTLTRPSYARGYAIGSGRVHFRDLTADTGNYASGGVTITAQQVGFKVVHHVSVDGGVATTGTAGATANPIGITYAADGTSFTVWLYESGASGAALGQKTNGEALETNFTCRLRIEGR